MDIYFLPEYGKLNESIENGSCERFVYEGTEGRITNTFIKRMIPIQIANQTYFDIITPYGYGGPIVDKYEVGDRKHLIRSYEEAFADYCCNNNIITEFIRFHPILRNHLDFGDIYSPQMIRRTIGTNLTLENPFQQEFHKYCRRNIRRAFRDGVHYKITEKPTNISKFIDIYERTMDRNSADQFYYFSTNYFSTAIKLLRDYLLLIEIVYDNTCIGAGLYFIYKDMIHIHLDGTLSQYNHLSPSSVLKYAALQWGVENGYKLMHHGGGRSNNYDDSLLLFKKQFGSLEFDYHISKKVWNKDIYTRLCDKMNIPVTCDYFPAYRYKSE